MKIQFWTNSPYTNTGYGIQTRNVLPHLIEMGHSVSVVANYGLQGNVITWNGIPIYPLKEERHNLDVLDYYIDHFGADVLISLYDLWSLPNSARGIIQVPWIAFIPVDGEPVSNAMLKRIPGVDYPVTYSKFGHRQFEMVGVETDYVPHGIDTDLFSPGNKEAARDYLGLPQDRYIVTVVAANKGTPPRKSWPEIFRAFKMFHDNNPDAMLYCHTTTKPLGSQGQGIYMNDLKEKVGLPVGTVAYPNQGRLAMGLPDEHMVQVYRASDVFLLPSRGEGFGIPVLEAQACGIPVITQDCSAMSELTVNGISIPKGQQQFVQALSYYWYIPAIIKIYDALMELRSWSEDKLNESSQQGVEFAQQYKIKTVFDKYWVPFLEKVEAEMW